MNNRLIISNLLRFLLFMLMQVLVLNYINLFGYINPYFFIFFILLLPFETPAYLVLLIGFSSGLVMDGFSDSGGIHAAAGSLISFIRPSILKTISARREYEPGVQARASDLGWPWFLKYTLIMVSIYEFVIICLELFRLSLIPAALLRFGLSVLLTMTLIVIYEFLFRTTRKKM